jgi:hypothetical protein
MYFVFSGVQLGPGRAVVGGDHHPEHQPIPHPQHEWGQQGAWDSVPQGQFLEKNFVSKKVFPETVLQQNLNCKTNLATKLPSFVTITL